MFPLAVIDNSIWLAIIAAIPTVLVGVGLPIIMARINNAQKNLEQQAAWDREDRKALAQQITANQDVATDQRAKINDKLETIHHLCNGTVTTAMESELNALEGVVHLHAQLAAHKRALKLPPDDSARAQLANAQSRIGDLKTALSIRAAAQQQATVMAPQLPTPPEPPSRLPPPQHSYQPEVVSNVVRRPKSKVRRSHKKKGG